MVAVFSGRPRWIWDIPKEVWPYTIQVDYDRYVVPRKNTVGWFINHSCEPNCVISGRSIRTCRDIKAGEELTFDYSTDVDWKGFRMKCACDTSGCRGVIRAYRYLPLALKLGYGPQVAPFIAREYVGGWGPRRREAPRASPRSR